MIRYLLVSSILIYASGLNAQIVNIDTVKSTYTYNRLPNRTSAQPEYMYTIGLKLLTVQQLPKIMKQVKSSDFYNSSLNGIVIKFNDNQISYRIVADFFNKRTSFKNECEDCEIASGKITDYSIAIGFEKKVTYARFQPYFGADVGFRANKFNGESHNAGAINFTSPYDIIAEKNGALFSPLIGFKFGLADHITLGAESAISILFSYETQNKSYKDATRITTFQNYRKWEFLLKPLSMLSIQYNLGPSN